MRERRNDHRRAAVRAASLGAVIASIGRRLWAKAAHRPADSLAILGACAASLIVIVNALFLQSGPHQAPYFANPTAQPPAAEMPKVAVTGVPRLVETLPMRATATTRTPQTVPARRNDPIADLIGSSIGSPVRVTAVQRVLSEFGYGQIRPSGILDEPTSAAIEKFESEHKLPVTGRLSDRLLGELSAMTGHPIE